MMGKKETYRYLDSKGISYEVTEHKAVYNMEEAAAINLPYPESEAKNLFIRDKSGVFCLITVKGDKRVDLNDFRRRAGLKRFRFASADDLKEMLGLEPGSVTPLGLLNDSECKVILYFDREFIGGIIGIHPNDNTATVWMKTSGLLRIIKDHGTEVHVIDI